MTPAEQGYIFPAEWEEHEAVFLAWPHDNSTFPELDKVEDAYVNILTALQESEQVNLFVLDKKMEDKVRFLANNRGLNLKKINFIQHNYADVWIRDYGP